MIKIRPGQIWLDDEGLFDAGYDGEMAYVVKSKEPDENWILVCFQEWTMGAYTREFNDEEINKMKYIGTIADVKKLEEFTWRDGLIVLGFFVALIITLIFI